MSDMVVMYLDDKCGGGLVEVEVESWGNEVGDILIRSLTSDLSLSQRRLLTYYMPIEGYGRVPDGAHCESFKWHYSLAALS
jgi:hypothetical protein